MWKGQIYLMNKKIYILETGLLYDSSALLGVFTEDKKNLALAHPIFKYEKDWKRFDRNEEGGVYLEGEEIWISLKAVRLNKYEEHPLIPKQLEQYLKENS